MKNLRGGRFDIFGVTSERKMERRLIVEYEEVVAEILVSLNGDNYSTAIDLANSPDTIRGFGPVKLAAVEKVAEEKTALLARYRGEKPNADSARKAVEAAE